MPIYFGAPAIAENIGMAVRGMWNFGLNQCNFVAPRAGEYPCEKAISASSGAAEFVYPHSKIYENCQDALAGVHLVIATSARKREQAIEVVSPEITAKRIHDAINQNLKVAVLFGAERTGLTNDEICMANFICEFPTNIDFPSLNLANAVSLLAYEMSKNTQESVQNIMNHDIAPFEETNHLITRIIDEITARGFFKSPEMKPVVARNIRNYLQRARGSSQELRTFEGIITILTKEQNHAEIC